MDPTLITITGVLIGCILSLSWFAGSDAPYIPTKMEIIKKALITAGVKKGKKFYELGSGDGRVVLQAALMGANSVGIEQSWIRIIYSRIKAIKLQITNANFYHGNIFKRNYFDADIIYIYLLPIGVVKLEEKLKNELKKGSIVVTQTFHFKNWKPFKKINLEDTGKKTRWDIKGAGNFQFYLV